jgi:hypothetical protein
MIYAVCVAAFLLFLFGPANGPTNQLRAATARYEATRRGSCRA